MANYYNIDKRVYAILKTYLGDDIYCQMEGDNLICEASVNNVNCKITFTDMAEGLANNKGCLCAETFAVCFLGNLCRDIKNA